VVQEEKEVEIRIDGPVGLPTLIYLPGLHGDWTLLPGFREQAKSKFRLVQFTYPRTLKWTLVDYARAVDEALNREGIRSGWILAESYSSQVAWEWLRLGEEKATEFQFEGLILAGGFVRYPMRFNLGVVRAFFAIAPWWLWRVLLRVYLAYSGFRHRNAGPVADCAKEFVERRTKSDIAAMRARLGLIANADFRAVARQARCPIFHLAGIIDPVVPPFSVARWLKRNCPEFRETKVIRPADHNVLGTEPQQALRQIEEWVSRSSACLK